MQRNIGTIDLVVRAVLGLSLVVYLAKDGFFVPGSGLGVLVGSYLIGTGMLSFDPVYKMLGISTYGPLDRSV
ncbi:MAG TPA: DUF2892 domain-containing protein [Bradyrhizobium sp.]|uniref:YgaP family membrane protein n=1 Tax=Bradyrhizobium sp. TaxID=376 RepID=UPI002D7F0733|nr:DUF2892 domain-containing protein [Bradyrhizobium sp.]HET7884833.1 DUF2892 domain-containing protein [Bradyrhizobium sp.]